jgi:hypothetical protein
MPKIEIIEWTIFYDSYPVGVISKEENTGTRAFREYLNSFEEKIEEVETERECEIIDRLYARIADFLEENTVAGYVDVRALLKMLGEILK